MATPAITAFLPFVTSGSIFAPRRIGKGNGRDNPILSIMDYDVAAGQTAKVVEGAANIAKEANPGLAASIIEKENALNNFLKTDKIAGSAGKVLRFTMNNINPLIGTTEAVKVMFADDKQSAAITSGCAFGGMLLGEGAAKRIMGLAQTSYKDGKYEITPREPLYKRLPFYKQEQADAIKKFCETKTFMGKHVFKHAPKVGKGLLFVGASIGSYMGGNSVGEHIAKTLKENNHAEKIPLNSSAQTAYTQAA